MLRRGLKTLDELDAVEEAEHLKKENAEKLSKQLAPEASPPDPLSFASPTSDPFL